MAASFPSAKNSDMNRRTTASFCSVDMSRSPYLMASTGRACPFEGERTSAEYVTVLPISSRDKKKRGEGSYLGRITDPVRFAQGVRLDQLVFQGRPSRSSARGDLELAVDRTQVCIGSTRTHDEPLGNLGGGQPPRHQAQNFDLAGSQPERLSL